MLYVKKAKTAKLAEFGQQKRELLIIILEYLTLKEAKKKKTHKERTMETDFISDGDLAIFIQM